MVKNTMEWIPVIWDRSLAPFNEWCYVDIVMYGERYCDVRWNGNRFVSNNDYTHVRLEGTIWNDEYVTHWMPAPELPEIPKE